MNTAYAALVIGYLQPELVRNVLAQLSRQTVLPERVIIVDNGGTFSDADRKSWPLANRSTLISRPENPGYAAAVNEARHMDIGDALLVLTHDANFPDTLAECLLETLTTGVGSVGPMLYFRDAPEKLFSAGGKLNSSGLASHLRRPLSQKPYEVDWIDGAIVIFRVQALDEVGWMDEQYFLYFEDVDTSWRLRAAGWVNVITSSLLAFQQPGSHPTYLGFRNMALFSRKANISPLRHLTAIAPRLAREFLASVLRGSNFKLSDATRGLRDGYAGLSSKQTSRKDDD